MANPASITPTELTRNAAITQPAGSAIDTNGNVPINANSDTSRLMIEIINTDDAALTATVKAGDNPPAINAGQGDLAISLAASGSPTDKRIIGPLESARFIQDDGTLILNFQAATGAPAATVRAYRLPK